MLLSYLLFEAIHLGGRRAWITRFVCIGAVAGTVYFVMKTSSNPLTQNVVGGLIASLLALITTWVYRDYSQQSHIFKFWGGILPPPRTSPICIVLGFRVEAGRRNMGYGQAMALPLVAQLLRGMNFSWDSDAQAPVRYADTDLDPTVATIIIGGPLTNRHTKSMLESMKLPYTFGNIDDGQDERNLISEDMPTSYTASRARNTDCGMIVVLRQPSGVSHIYLVGGKRLGVLAATMIVTQRAYLSAVLRQGRPTSGSFQIVFGAKVSFDEEKVCSIDVETIRLLQIAGEIRSVPTPAIKKSDN